MLINNFRPFQITPFSFFKKIRAHLLFYIILFSFIHYTFPKNGFHIPNPFETYLEKRTQTVVELVDEKNLATNFLANKRKLSPQEQDVFQVSGLMHLLAISGGQMGLLTWALSSLFSILFIFLLYHKINTLSLGKFLFYTRMIIDISVSLFVTLFFNLGGALMRVSFLRYLRRISFIATISSFFTFTFKKGSPISWNRTLMLLGLSFFTNPTTNLSFLLSATGASVAVLSAKLCQGFTFESAYQKISFTLPEFLRSIMATCLTSSLMALLMFPFIPTSIFTSALANTLAGPLVTLIITPLSLLSLSLPENSFFLLITHFLDLSLSLLYSIAHLLALHESSISQETVRTAFSSPYLPLLLLGTLMVLWSLEDTSEERDLFPYLRKDSL